METSLSLGWSDVCSQLDSGVNLGEHTAEMKLCLSGQVSSFEALGFDASHCRYTSIFGWVWCLPSFSTVGTLFPLCYYQVSTSRYVETTYLPHNCYFAANFQLPALLKIGLLNWA